MLNLSSPLSIGLLAVSRCWGNLFLRGGISPLFAGGGHARLHGGIVSLLASPGVDLTRVPSACCALLPVSVCPRPLASAPSAALVLLGGGWLAGHVRPRDSWPIQLQVFKAAVPRHR